MARLVETTPYRPTGGSLGKPRVCLGTSDGAVRAQGTSLAGPAPDLEPFDSITGIEPRGSNSSAMMELGLLIPYMVWFLRT